jgi:hypothetical protein
MGTEIHHSSAVVSVKAMAFAMGDERMVQKAWMENPGRSSGEVE